MQGWSREAPRGAAHVSSDGPELPACPSRASTTPRQVAFGAFCIRLLLAEGPPTSLTHANLPRLGGFHLLISHLAGSPSGTSMTLGQRLVFCGGHRAGP